MSLILPQFPVDEWLDNLLLDQHREAYASMTPEQKTCVRFSYNYGWQKAKDAQTLGDDNGT